MAFASVAFLMACVSDPEEQIERIYQWKKNPTPDNLARIRGSLKDEHRDVRAAALSALVQAPVVDALQLALGALEDKDGFVRATAARGLGELRVSSASVALASHLKSDPDSHVRERAAQALAALGGPDAVETLAPGLLDPVSEVRLAAVRGAAGLDPGASFEILARITLDDPEWQIRVEAARALGQSKRPEATVPLEAARADPNEFVRAAAYIALRLVRAEARAVPAAPAESPGGLPPTPRPEPGRD